MKAIPFNINAVKQNDKAQIKITGNIGLDVNAELFRAQVEAIANEGITDAHVYINSPGGSVFDAAEIVNIIRTAFTGQITGEGGALVASAATYIALQCSTFTMPENGMFMIHKPAGNASGNAQDVEAYLKLLQTIEEQYYQAYKNVAKDGETFEQMWKSGADWWMTANEAKENGFISAVQGETAIDTQTNALIVACGCPAGKLPGKKRNDLAKVAEALQINPNSSLDDILKEIARLKGEERPEDIVQAALTRGTIQTFESDELLSIARTSPQAFTRLLQKRVERGEREHKARIAKMVSDAIYEKRIVATAKNHWETLLSTDYDTAHAALMEMEPVQKIATKHPRMSGENRSNWTLDDYRKKDPRALQNDPELYDKLIQKECKNNQ